MRWPWGKRRRRSRSRSKCRGLSRGKLKGRMDWQIGVLRIIYIDRRIGWQYRTVRQRKGY